MAIRVKIARTAFPKGWPDALPTAILDLPQPIDSVEFMNPFSYKDSSKTNSFASLPRRRINRRHGKGYSFNRFILVGHSELSLVAVSSCDLNAFGFCLELHREIDQKLSNRSNLIGK